MIKKLAFYTSLILFACCTNESSNEGYNVIQLNDAEELDILNRENNSDEIYIGTKNFDSILKTYKPIQFEVINKSEWQNDTNYNWLKNKDSIFTNLLKDTFIINHWFLSKGKCWHYYPYLVKSQDTIKLFCPEKVAGNIELINGDTIYSNTGCSTETIALLAIKIPKTEIKHFKSILFKNKTFKIDNQ